MKQKLWALAFLLASMKTWSDFFRGGMDRDGTQGQPFTQISFTTRPQFPVCGSMKCFSCNPVEDRGFHWQHFHFYFEKVGSVFIARWEDWGSKRHRESISPFGNLGNVEVSFFFFPTDSLGLSMVNSIKLNMHLTIPGKAFKDPEDIDTVINPTLLSPLIFLPWFYAQMYCSFQKKKKKKKKKKDCSNGLCSNLRILFTCFFMGQEKFSPFIRTVHIFPLSSLHCEIECVSRWF